MTSARHRALNDALAKLDRADAHLLALRRAIDQFILGNPYDVRPSRVAGTREVYLWLNVHWEPESAAWAPVIGDVVNNIRSALDNLVWGLSVHFAATPPPPDPIPHGDPWRTVSFPVVLDAAKWQKAGPRRALWAVPHLWSKFRDLQPFAVSPADPAASELAILDELWNIDKHRHLHTGVFIQQLGGIFTVTGEDGTALPYRVVKTHPAGPFSDGADLGVIELLTEPAGEPSVTVNTTMMFDVVLDQAPSAYQHKGLFDLLGAIRNRARHIVLAFEQELH